ncbi:MAG: hypothetical protein KC422_22325 [Trueperaceae bacterium]|nr:hypothetical protein [Trueperaceae bacterium]
MLKKLGLGLIFIIFSLAFAQSSEYQCMTAFEATIHEGPSAGTTLIGKLGFAVDDAGMLSGMLYNDEGSIVANGALEVADNQLPVMGQVNGLAVNLAIPLGGENYVFGVGTSTMSLADCQGIYQGVMGGPAVGPASGDQGDWVSKVCASVEINGKVYRVCVTLE